MRIKINREQPFQVLATNFSIGPSSSGYDLQISADGINFTTLFSVGANVTRMVTGVANGSTYRLEGNTDEDVIVNWTRQCDDGQGGGGGEGPQGPAGPQGPQGPAGSGSTSDFNKLMAVPDFPDSAETGEVIAINKEAEETWIDFEDNAVPGEQKLVRVEASNDGTYLFHYNDNESWVGLTLSSGEFSIDGGLESDGENRWSITNGAEGNITYDGTYLIAEITDDTNYWSACDMYGTGGQRAYATVVAGVMGLFQYDGENWSKVGNAKSLEAVDEFPSDANVGDVVAYSVSTSGLPSGILFESGNTYDETENQFGATFSFPMGAFALRTEANPVYVGKAIVEAWGETTELCMYVYADGYNPNGATFCVSNTCDIDNKTLNYEIGTYAESFKEIISNIYFDHQYTDQEEGYMTVDVYTNYEDEGNTTLTFELAEGGSENGLFQFDGTSWNPVGGGASEQNLIHLDAIDDTTTGETGKVYECNGRLFRWVEGAGSWGKWLGGWDNTYPSGAEPDGFYGVQLNYAYLPSELTQIGISYRMNTVTGYLYWDPENSSFVSYSDSEMQTEVSRVYLGDENTVIGPYSSDSSRVWLTWKDGVLKFKCGQYASFRSRVSAYTANDHFEVVNSGNFAHAFDCIPNGSSTLEGIPVWNSEGIIVSRRAAYSTKSVYINSTGSSTSVRTDYLTNGTNGGANRMFVPTVPGTAGQVLTSAGNAEPTWATIIKAQKITSDAYEALVQAGTTDPNVLYLIDDE